MNNPAALYAQRVCQEWQNQIFLRVENFVLNLWQLYPPVPHSSYNVFLGWTVTCVGFESESTLPIRPPHIECTAQVVHRVHTRVAKAAFCRTHHQGKISPGRWGWGCTAAPFHYIYHHVQSCSVRSSWEVRYTPPISFHLYPYVLCGSIHLLSTGGGAGETLWQMPLSLFWQITFETTYSFMDIFYIYILPLWFTMWISGKFIPQHLSNVQSLNL